MNLHANESSPTGTYAEGMPWNPVERVILERRSIRSFRPEPLPDGMIRRILEAGRFAPSAGNMQPWRFVVIKSPEIIAAMERDAVRIVRLFMFFLDYARGGRVRRAITMPLAKLFIRLLPNELHAPPFMLLSQIAQGRAPVFHNAPVIVLILEDRRGVSCPAVDIGVCGQNMVLAAHSMGAGSCWIGLIKLLRYYPKWRRRLGARYPYHMNESIAFGWPRPTADGLVPREVQIVEWREGGPDDPPRYERQGG